MQSAVATPPTSKALVWTGRILTGLVAAFMLLDAAMKLAKPEFVVKATVELGYPESVIVGLGIVLAVCTVLSLIPRTSILGAILLTGYLGGACASHLRHGDGWFPILFPVVFGMLLWGGLCLRDERLRTLLPLRTRPKAIQDLAR
jgi:hypothetical protein